MDNRIHLISLYDIYGGLLTDKQQAYFEDYYFNNLSLQEICDLYGISRNAVHKQLKEVTDKLSHYEEVLELLNKKNKIKKLIENLEIKEQIEDLL